MSHIGGFIAISLFFGVFFVKVYRIGIQKVLENVRSLFYAI